MATELKCDYCNAALDKNATLVHTERHQGLWDLNFSMCADCFKHLKVMLEKAKSQKSWTWWTALEQEVASLKKETESLKSELQFLRQHDPTCEQSGPDDKLLKVRSEGGAERKVHRSILISRSAVFKEYLTSEGFKKLQRKYPHEPINLECVPTHPDSFGAFIDFLYTAELEPEILKHHAPELMEAGNKNAIDILTRKCENYIVNNMTDENTVNYLKVAEQCNSKAITAAAVKQIQSDPKEFVYREDYQALQKNNPAALSKAFDYVMMLDPPSGKKKGKKPKGSDSGPVPGSDPVINSSLPRDRYGASYRPLGTCTCSVHPFAHSAAPGFQYQVGHFHTATGMPSTEYYVAPASVPDK